MALSRIEALIRTRLGLSPPSLGANGLQKAVARRMALCGIADEAAYLRRVLKRPQEWEALCEALLVPETWFFRSPAAFDFLGERIQNQTLRPPLRVLSLACATGEEPYSAAITLAEAGLSPHQARIRGIDISGQALSRARAGIYPESALRRLDLERKRRYFQPLRSGWRIADFLKDWVRFDQANVLSLDLAEGYDIVFCRNLLIYLTEAARERVARTVYRLLAKDGVLFSGHAEGSAFEKAGFVWIPRQGAFAWRPARPEKPAPVISSQPSAPGPDLSAIPSPKPTLPPPPARSAPSSAASPGRTDLFESARQLADQGKLSQALPLCQKHLHHHPAHVKGNFLMAVICQALDQEQWAESYFNKVLYLDPHHSEALHYLACIAESRGDQEGSRRLRRRAHRIAKEEKP